MGGFYRYFVLSVFSFLLILTIVSAESGCFLEPDSNDYCTQLEYQDAELECSYFDSCNIETSFASDKRCSLFEECEKILCKATCRETLAGLCSSGPVPEGEESLWCQSDGCCQYWQQGSEPFCAVKSNKWLCHIAASNVGASNLNWDQSKDQNVCEETCLSDNYPYSSKLADYNLPFYSKTKTLTSGATKNSGSLSDSSDSSSSGSITNKKSQVPEQLSGSTSSEKSSIMSKLFNLLAPFFLLFVILLFCIFFYEHRHTFSNYFQKLKVSKPKSSKQKSPISLDSKKDALVSNFQSSTSTNSQNYSSAISGLKNIKSRSDHHKRHLHQKHLQFELENSFLGVKAPVPKEESSLKRLQRIVKTHQKKQLRKKKNKASLSSNSSK